MNKTEAKPITDISGDILKFCNTIYKYIIKVPFSQFSDELKSTQHTVQLRDS